MAVAAGHITDQLAPFLDGAGGPMNAVVGHRLFPRQEILIFSRQTPERSAFQRIAFYLDSIHFN